MIPDSSAIGEGLFLGSALIALPMIVDKKRYLLLYEAVALYRVGVPSRPKIEIDNKMKLFPAMCSLARLKVMSEKGFTCTRLHN